MTGLWVAAAALCVVTVAVIVVPLVRGRPSEVGREQFDVAVFKAQLAEIDRDVERGLIAGDEAESARLEVKRRILAVASDADDAATSASGPSGWRLAAVLATIVPALAFGLYFVLGTPGVPDRPFAGRPAPAAVDDASAAPANLDEALARLAARLKVSPDDAEGWLLLGRGYLSLERYGDGAFALGKAAALQPDRADIAAQHGEALAAAVGGQISPEARAAFEAALRVDPGEPRARYYLALERAQAGDLAAALQGWADLIVLSPPDAPWLATVREQMQRAAQELGIDPGGVSPSAEAQELAAERGLTGRERANLEAWQNLSPGEREAMIRAMVDGLAQRLAQHPDDAEGWRRLARAYEVLGETEKAREARTRAESLTGR